MAKKWHNEKPQAVEPVEPEQAPEASSVEPEAKAEPEQAPEPEAKPEPSKPEAKPAELLIGTFAADNRASQIAVNELTRGLNWFGWKVTVKAGASAGVEVVTAQKVR